MTAHNDANAQTATEDERRTTPLLALLALAVLIVLIVLLLSRYGSEAAAEADGGASADTLSIVDVEGASTQRGMVAVWISEGVEIDQVLSDAKLGSAEYTDMGGGRYAVSVPTGSERQAIENLVAADEVVDAGYVFQER